MAFDDMSFRITRPSEAMVLTVHIRLIFVCQENSFQAAYARNDWWCKHVLIKLCYKINTYFKDYNDDQ